MCYIIQPVLDQSLKPSTCIPGSPQAFSVDQNRLTVGLIFWFFPKRSKNKEFRTVQSRPAGHNPPGEPPRDPSLLNQIRSIGLCCLGCRPVFTYVDLWSLWSAWQDRRQRGNSEIQQQRKWGRIVDTLGCYQGRRTWIGRKAGEGQREHEERATGGQMRK